MDHGGIAGHRVRQDAHREQRGNAGRHLDAVDHTNGTSNKVNVWKLAGANLPGARHGTGHGEVAKLVTVAADEDEDVEEAASLMSVCEGTPPGVIAEKDAASSATASAAGGTSMTKSLSTASDATATTPELQGHGQARSVRHCWQPTLFRIDLNPMI
jgi:hypothetical protein